MRNIVFYIAIVLLSTGYSFAGSNLDVGYVRKQLKEGFVKESFKYYTGAVDAYKKAGEKPDLNELLGIGEVFMSFGCVEKALKVYKDATLFYPDNSLPDFVVAHIAYSIKRYDMAVKYFEKAIKIARKDKNNIPKITEAYLLIIKSCFHSENVKAIKKYYNELIAYVEKYDCLLPVEEINTLVKIFKKFNLFTEENKLYEFLYSEVAPRFSNGNINVEYPVDLGDVFFENGDMERALRFYEYAVGAGYKSPRLSLMLGHIYFEKKEYNKAVRHLKDFLENSGGIADIESVSETYVLLMKSYEFSKGVDMRALFSKWIDCMEEHNYLPSKEDVNSLIKIFKKFGFLAEENELYEFLYGAVSSRFSNGNINVEYPADFGDVFFENGDMERALRFYEYAVGAGYKSPRLLLRLGHIYFEKREYDEAVRHLKNFLENSVGIADIESVSETYVLLMKSYFYMEKKRELLNVFEEFIKFVENSNCFVDIFDIWDILRDENCYDECEILLNELNNKVTKSLYKEIIKRKIKTNKDIYRWYIHRLERLIILNDNRVYALFHEFVNWCKLNNYSIALDDIVVLEKISFMCKYYELLPCMLDYICINDNKYYKKLAVKYFIGDLIKYLNDVNYEKKSVCPYILAMCNVLIRKHQIIDGFLLKSMLYKLKAREFADTNRCESSKYYFFAFLYSFGKWEESVTFISNTLQMLYKKIRKDCQHAAKFPGGRGINKQIICLGTILGYMNVIEIITFFKQYWLFFITIIAVMLIDRRFIL